VVLGRSYGHGSGMEPQSGERPLREEEARYLTVGLANQTHADAMLVSARLTGRTWVDALKMLQEAAVAET